MENVVVEEVDRISTLPKDILLHHILCGLSMKEVTRMTILSSKWKHICASILNLDFDDQVWNSIPNLNSEDEKRMGRKRIEFVEVVNRLVMNHKDSKLRRFRLYFYPGEKYRSKAVNWLKIAIMKGVEDIDLDLYMEFGKYFDLPSFVMECESISSLKLKYSNLNLTSSSKGPVALKFLYLEEVKVTDDDIGSLLSTCSHIEALYLKDCHQLQDLNVSYANPRFRSLTAFDNWNLNSIEINAPHLQSFQYRGHHVKFLLKNIVGLQHAMLNTTAFKRGQEGVKIKIYQDPKVVLALIGHVEVLCLSGYFIKIMYAGSAAFSDWRICHLHNLKELQVQIDLLETIEVCYFTYLLQMCPNLEKLFIEVDESKIAEHPGSYVEYALIILPDIPEEFTVYKCKLDNLNIIEFKGFTGSSYELMLVENLFESAFGLKLLNLIHPPEYKVDHILENVLWHVDQKLVATGRGVPPASVCRLIAALSDASPKPEINLQPYSASHKFAFNL